MRWEDERYVRLYTRDTTTWKLLPWQSKALFPLILRKVDRAGILDLGEDGMDGLSAVLDMPTEFVEAGLPQLIKRGVIVVVNGRLVMPNFIAAQECRQTDAQRKRDSRERQRIESMSSGEPESVTPADISSRIVTESHQPSPIVTASHHQSLLAVPSLAVPSQAKEDPPTPVPVERDRPWRVSKADAECQRQFWSSAYAESVSEARGNPGWIFMPEFFGALQAIIEARCTGDDRKDIDGWIRREVPKFVRGVQALDEDPAYWSGFSPKGFARWLNDPRSTPKPKVKNTFTDFTYAGRVAHVANAQHANGGPQPPAGDVDEQKTTTDPSGVFLTRPEGSQGHGAIRAVRGG